MANKQIDVNDIIGQKTNMLTILNFDHKVKRSSGIGYEYYYNCLCECGNYKIINRRNLKNKETISCGCIQKQKIKESIKFTPNIYNLEGKYGIGYTKNNEEFYFDLEDYNKIKNYRWYKEKKGGYISSRSNGGFIKMHQLLKCKFCDHINGCAYDNRKNNLRECTYSQNNMNKGFSIRNKSGVIGVCYDRNKQKWLAQIKKDNIRKSKYFNDFNDAIKCRQEWEKEYFKNFSPLESRGIQYVL